MRYFDIICYAPMAKTNITIHLLYVRSSLTLKNSTWCSHYVYVFCTTSQPTTTFALQTLANWFCITEVDSFYCEVLTKSLYKIDTFSLQRVNFQVPWKLDTNYNVHMSMKVS